MNYFFFNTITPDIFIVPDGEKRVWLPLGENVVPAIQHVISRNKIKGEIKIENILEHYFSPGTKDGFEFIEVQSPTPSTPRKHHFAFFATNDPIANSMLPVIKNAIKSHKVDVYVPGLKNERADVVFEKAGIPFSYFSFLHFIKNRPELMLFANDWGEEEALAGAMCRKLGIKTVCIQESVINFSKQKGWMTNSETVIIQGSNTVTELDRELYFISGNPRYEHLKEEALPPENRAMINCNFTYNVYENERNGWMREITSTLDKLSIEYMVSQHPRDAGDLSAFRNVERSNADIVHNHVKSSSFLITRFSSLIHETLMMGRKVIYYNSFGENLQYDYGFDDENIFLASTPQELEQKIKLLFSKMDEEQKSGGKSKNYLIKHCHKSEKASSAIVVELLEQINNSMPPQKSATNFIEKLIRYMRAFLRIKLKPKV